MTKQIEQVLDSREVAQMVGKRHDNLVRDIKGYMEELWLLKNEEPNKWLKIQPSDFFERIHIQIEERNILASWLLKRMRVYSQ